jgi:hypothetical protein
LTFPAPFGFQQHNVQRLLMTISQKSHAISTFFEDFSLTEGFEPFIGSDCVFFTGGLFFF